MTWTNCDIWVLAYYDRTRTGPPSARAMARRFFILPSPDRFAGNSARRKPGQPISYSSTIESSVAVDNLLQIDALALQARLRHSLGKRPGHLAAGVGRPGPSPCGGQRMGDGRGHQGGIRPFIEDVGGDDQVETAPGRPDIAANRRTAWRCPSGRCAGRWP